MGVGRPVKLGMVLPFTSVVTVLSNVVSRVLSNKIEKSLDTGSPGAMNPECMSTGRLMVESNSFTSLQEPGCCPVSDSKPANKVRQWELPLTLGKRECGLTTIITAMR